MMEPIRLQKYFTDCGVLSRRAAEEQIRRGAVTVNGITAEVGQKIDPDTDVVEYEGRVVAPTTSTHHYVLLNKPRGFVTTLSDEKGRHTVSEIVAELGVRLYPVGRLDMDSDGALLLTDDGALTQKLTHPRHEIPKHYEVTVRGRVSAAQLERLCGSFLLDGYATRPAEVKLLAQDATSARLSFTLYEGRNRQIRRMCEEVKLSITRLSRVAIGNITLKDVEIGKYRHLTPQEIDYLKGN
jgi:23S rRNA pseudouridine2605 synthase